MSGNVRLFDDYAHHPVEIAAVLESARSVSDGRVIAVVQPHRYSRLRDLFDDFCTCMNGADSVLVLPVYEAGEQPIDGIHADALAAGLRDHGHRHAEAVPSDAELAESLAAQIQDNDVVICMGAGSISALAHQLPDQLEAMRK